MDIRCGDYVHHWRSSLQQGLNSMRAGISFANLAGDNTVNAACLHCPAVHT